VLSDSIITQLKEVSSPERQTAQDRMDSAF